MSVLTHVVFDFDGTLVDSGKVAVRIYNALAEEHGYGQLTHENLEALRAASMLERCRILGLPPTRLPWLVARVLSGYREALRSVSFVDGVPELLAALRERGLKVFIVSTNDAENIRSVFAQHGKAEWIDGVHCSRSLFGKAAVLRRVMKQERLTTDAMVYVGDEERDIVACKEAKVRVAAVGWGFDARERLEQAGPDFYAQSPAALLAWLGTLHEGPKGAGASRGVD